MIGKPEWFTYRKFGWGIAPKTWQGWVYVAVLAVIAGLVTALTLTKFFGIWVFAVMFAVIAFDTIHIMSQLHKFHDERENLHQLIIERNCSYAAILGLILAGAIQTLQNWDKIKNGFPYDYWLLIILGIMVVTKVVSSFYVKHKF